MLILAVICAAFAAACWFSQPFPHPFLGLALFEINPLISLAGSLFLASLALILWLSRRGLTKISHLIRIHTQDLSEKPGGFSFLGQAKCFFIDERQFSYVFY